MREQDICTGVGVVLGRRSDAGVGRSPVPITSIIKTTGLVAAQMNRDVISARL
jgi:hypothetical protein